MMDDITNGQSMVLKKIVRPGVGLNIPDGATVKGKRTRNKIWREREDDKYMHVHVLMCTY